MGPAAAAAAPEDDLGRQLTVFIDALAKSCGVNRAAIVASLNDMTEELCEIVVKHLEAAEPPSLDAQLSAVRADLDHLAGRLGVDTGPTFTCSALDGKPQTFTLSAIEKMDRLPQHLRSQLSRDMRAGLAVLTGRVGRKQWTEGKALATLLRRAGKGS